MSKQAGEETTEERGRAGTATAAKRWSVVHMAVAGVLLVLFFWPAFYWAGQQLDSGDEPWQLVFVPFLSAMVLSRRIPEVRGETMRGGMWLGIPLMAAGALLNLFGIVIEHPMPSQMGMIVFIQGGVLFAWGKKTYRELAFPLLYLFLAIPLPRTVLVAVTGSLKTLGAAVAGKLLSWMGYAVLRDGVILNFPTFTLVVEDECSGLQSLITLIVASLPVAYLMRGPFWKRALVVLIAVPLALAANVVRLVVTAVLASGLGGKVTRGWPHTSIGIATVFVAFLALYGLSSVIGDRASLKSERENELVNGSA